MFADQRFETHVGRDGKPFSDPGQYNPEATEGTVGHAQTLRVSLRNAIAELPSATGRVKRYVDYFIGHRTWELLNRRDGGTFASFEEFCEAEQPWGLATPYVKIKAFVEAALARPEHADAGKVALEYEANPKPASPPGKKTDTVSDKSDGLQRKEQRLRAVSRAPEPAVNLYKAGLLGQKEAAKLGPKNPTPEEAAKVTEVARTAAEVAKAEPKPKTEPERKKLQQKINAVVREALGVEDDRVAKVARLVAGLEDSDLERLIDLLGPAGKKRLSRALENLS